MKFDNTIILSFIFGISNIINYFINDRIEIFFLILQFIFLVVGILRTIEGE